MKVSDIKGDLGKHIVYWVEGYINNLVFDEVARVAPNVHFYDKIYLWRMEDFKKMFSGERIGWPTHGCEPGRVPWRSWCTRAPRSTRCKEPVNIDIRVIDVDDLNGLFNIEVDLVDVDGDGRYWEIRWSIAANKSNLMAKLSEMFDDDLEKLKKTVHKDILGKPLKIGDIVCYSTTINNHIDVGTIQRFNDYKMVISGHDIPYDAGVLVVTDSVQFKNKKYEHI